MQDDHVAVSVSLLVFQMMNVSAGLWILDILCYCTSVDYGL